MCIEIGLHKFYKSNFDTKNRFVDINPSYKIDIKEWVEVDNDDQHIKRRIKRIKKDKRSRPLDSTRFTSSEPFTLLDKDGSQLDEYDKSWLGYQWYLKYNISQYYPTRRQIMNGIIKAEAQNVLSVKRVKFNDKRDTSLKCRKIAWKSLFQIFGLDQKDVVDEEISQKALCNPNDPLTIALIYIYNMDTFIP